MRLRPHAHTRAHNATPAATDEAPPPCADAPSIVDLEWGTAGPGRLTEQARAHAVWVIRDHCTRCTILDHCLDVVKPHLDEQSVVAGGIAWSHGVLVRAVTM